LKRFFSWFVYVILATLILLETVYFIPAHFAQKGFEGETLATIALKPTFWQYVPMLTGRANAIYPYIWLHSDIYNDLKSTHPSPESIATLIHEETHYARQREMGIGEYAARYVFSSSFRLEEELTAIRPQVEYLVSRGARFDIVDRARRLSGAEYLWAARYDEALSKLKEICGGC
jgi:hypothetical protein